MPEWVHEGIGTSWRRPVARRSGTSERSPARGACAACLRVGVPLGLPVGSSHRWRGAKRCRERGTACCYNVLRSMCAARLHASYAGVISPATKEEAAWKDERHPVMHRVLAGRFHDGEYLAGSL